MGYNQAVLPSAKAAVMHESKNEHRPGQYWSFAKDPKLASLDLYKPKIPWDWAFAQKVYLT